MKKEVYRVNYYDHGDHWHKDYSSMVEAQDEMIEWLQNRVSVYPFYINVVLL